MKRTIAKENRKTRYTKAALRDSLLELMQKKPLLRISLKEICELADVSRSTFYNYYDDQFELLKQIEDEILKKTSAIVGKARNIPLTKGSGLFALAEEMLQFMADNRNAMNVLFGQNSDERFKDKFVRHFYKQIINLNIAGLDKVDEYKKEGYSLHFVIGGIIFVLSEWVRNDMDIPIPEFAKIIVKLVLTTQGS